MRDIQGMLALHHTLEQALERFQEVITTEQGRAAIQALAARPAINDDAHRRASSQSAIVSAPCKNGDTAGGPATSDGEGPPCPPAI